LIRRTKLLNCPNLSISRCFNCNATCQLFARTAIRDFNNSTFNAAHFLEHVQSLLRVLGNVTSSHPCSSTVTGREVAGLPSQTESILRMIIPEQAPRTIPVSQERAGISMLQISKYLRQGGRAAHSFVSRTRKSSLMEYLP
jgi:hypothetical protein